MMGMGTSTCLSLIARHFPLSMTWCRCFTTFEILIIKQKKWNCRVKKREGIPTSCPVTSIGKTGPRNSIKDLLVGSRILTTPSHLCQEEYHKYSSEAVLKSDRPDQIYIWRLQCEIPIKRSNRPDHTFPTKFIGAKDTLAPQNKIITTNHLRSFPKLQ